MELDKKEMKCLLDNIYYEARGESLRGQILVARVTLNRAEVFGSVCAAVYQPYQFSWTQTKNTKPKPDIYERGYKAAYMALYYDSPIYYFHNKHVKPAWTKQKRLITKEQSHVFYK